MQLSTGPIKIIFEYRCCAPDCTSVHVVTREEWPGTEVFRMDKPVDWHSIWGQIYCPKHVLHVRLDEGEEFDL